MLNPNELYPSVLKRKGDKKKTTNVNKEEQKNEKKKVYAVCRRFDEKAAPHLSFAFVTLVLLVNIISCFIANLKFLFIDLRHS